MGDFNIYMDISNDDLGTAFTSWLDLIGFSQCVHEPTQF